jgi:hypothetical protein
MATNLITASIQSEPPITGGSNDSCPTASRSRTGDAAAPGVGMQAIPTTGNRTTRARLARAGTAVVATLLVAACGGSGTDSGDAAPGAASAPAGEAPAGEAPAGEAPAAGSADLSTAPIPFRDLYDFRSAGAPVAQTEAVQLDACPLLSLDTLVASSRAYPNPTVLTQATTQGCTFAGGPGFTLSVEVEAAADVDVDNHSGRAYNFDVEPIVEPQSGPGEKAVTLVDTAFADLSDEDGFRYLSFFVLGDQAVTLRANAFEVNDDGWRVLADEVAANLESGAAGGPVETVEVVDSVEAYTMEQCGFVTIDQLAALTGFDAASITTNHNPDRFQCRWEHPEQLGLSFRFGAAERNYADAVGIAPDADRQGELGILAVGPAVLYDVWLQAGDVRGFTANADSEGWFGAADAIAVNLVQRIEKPTPL